MKTLLVLRHAKSSWAEHGLDDHARPLNDRGREDAPRAGEMLVEHGLLPDAIVSSDAVRARQTADAVAEASGYQGEVLYDARLYAASPSEIAEVVRALGESAAGTVLIVGHNPGFEDLVARLTGAPLHLPTAALAQITLPITLWRDFTDDTGGNLVQVWRPKDGS